MATKKVYCEAVDGIVYSDRCPLKLSKMIADNKTCKNCLVLLFEKNERELKEALGIDKDRSKVKSARAKRSSDIKDISDMKDVKKKRKRIEATPGKKPKPIQNDVDKQMYSTQDLIDLLGKSERTIREWAQEGKIPARKVGRQWRFPKEEFDRWLSEKGHCTDIVMTMNKVSQEEDVRPPDQNDEGSTEPQEA